MASTPSTILRIQLIGTGDQAGTWGSTTNTNLGTLLEGAIAGLASVSVTAADQALVATDYVADQARMALITLTTTTSANFNVYAPPVSKQYTIYNNSSYTATIYNATAANGTTAAGTGIAIPAGKIMSVWSNGTNFYKNNTAQINLTTDVSGSLPLANGGTGGTDAATARTNLDVPTRTGGNASGTWAIDISGNAATATYATSAGSASIANNANYASNPSSGGTFITSVNIGSQSVSYASNANNAVYATQLSLNNWNVLISGNYLYFTYNGVNKMRLDNNGNLICVGNVVAYGTL